MAEKHYNSAYLSDTMRLLQGVKTKSYTFFESVTDDGTLVDLGCGTGQDVLNMAHTFPGNNLRFIGIDHDANMIAKENGASASDPRIEFLVGDALHIPLADTTVDGIRMERLVQHVADPKALFTEVYRVVKAGGRVVIVESDWKSIAFYQGDLAVADKLNQYLSAKKINNGKAAQSLTTYLEQWGFGEMTAEVFPFVLTRYADACTYLWIDKMIEEMVALDWITATQQQAFVAAQQAADARGFFACSMNIVLVSAVK